MTFDDWASLSADLRHKLNVFIQDQCEDEERVRELCKLVLPAEKVDGDTYGVPNTVELVGMLVARIAALEE